MCIHTVRPIEWAVEDFAAQIAARAAATLVSKKRADNRAAAEAVVASQVVDEGALQQLRDVFGAASDTTLRRELQKGGGARRTSIPL